MFHLYVYWVTVYSISFRTISGSTRHISSYTRPISSPSRSRSTNASSWICPRSSANAAASAADSDSTRKYKLWKTSNDDDMSPLSKSNPNFDQIRARSYGYKIHFVKITDTFMIDPVFS